MSGATRRRRWCVRARYGRGVGAARHTYRFASRRQAREWLRTMRALQRKPGMCSFVATQPIRTAKARA